ncbi:ribosome assembly cofactor RimP [Wenyingzhuangia sp. 2_MG-2023]|uniref:ribosome assembly cofactor RimP n=1 Tax=Wenyingzhuangia sp. 2_MG-2023 TaxID=3062639 RepID=UPI0026E1E956|nr:ribosome assembly cofactor RimP [Wenyingzhuangia sp. 2_MG-2023]MDO6737011.1 ribosome assembly cofactor RimP [Wenyingzhuangia sp. 2_MG-2023]MDO6801819.1 ribosome assembly cofactor RimP [Wenyingzhuangia sp. 1_MG-2023]
MDKNKVENYIDLALEENPSLFLVELHIDTDNKILVTIDGDKGVPLSECIRISRFVENNLDREEEDYSLEVATPDIAKPIVMRRQYVKNIGRVLKVKTEEKSYEGALTEVNDDNIVLVWETREPKPVGKGKITVEKTATLTYEEIKETKVKILF